MNYNDDRNLLVARCHLTGNGALVESRVCFADIFETILMVIVMV